MCCCPSRSVDQDEGRVGGAGDAGRPAIGPLPVALRTPRAPRAAAGSRVGAAQRPPLVVMRPPVSPIWVIFDTLPVSPVAGGAGCRRSCARPDGASPRLFRCLPFRTRRPLPCVPGCHTPAPRRPSNPWSGPLGAQIWPNRFSRPDRVSPFGAQARRPMPPQPGRSPRRAGEKRGGRGRRHRLPEKRGQVRLRSRLRPDGGAGGLP